MADPLLLSLAAGCTLLTVDTRIEVDDGDIVEVTRAEVRSDGTCTRVDVVAPPRVQVVERRARTRLSDDTGRKLGDGRWEVSPRGVDGVGHHVLHVPELLRADAVRIDVTRRWSGRDYRWAPGLDGAQWGEIRLPFEATSLITGALQGDGRDRWIAEPGPADGVLIAGPPATAAAAFAAGDLTPAEALARVSGWTLLPGRPDLPTVGIEPGQVGAASPERVAEALVAWTADGPSPLRLGRILPLGAPAAPGLPLEPIAATVDGDVARLWAHPDQRWSHEWRVLIEGQVLDAVATPAGGGPAAHAPAALRRRVELRIPEGSNPQVELVPGRGSSALQVDQWALVGVDTTRARIIDIEPGSTLVDVSSASAVHSQAVVNTTRDQVLLLAAPGEDPQFTVTTLLPQAPACGVEPELPDVDLVEYSVHGTGVEVRRDGSTWWVHEWDGYPLLTERARVVAGLHGRFNRRGIPEPGLPLRLRSRLDGWGLASEMTGALRAHAKVAALPGDPRWPRKLMRARRSGVVTSVEAALILRAYALQSKIEADWVLVRPASEGPGHGLCPVGYDVGLVRLMYGDKTRFIDPECTACAPFEVRPELLGASALGPWIEATPAPPKGRSEVQVADGRTVAWTLTGPAALELRRWLQPIPIDAREAALAERLAGPGASLTSAAGVAEAGADIYVVAEAAAPDRVPEPAALLLPEPRADGSLFLPWLGERRFVWDDKGADPIRVQLTVQERDVPADQVAALAAQLRRPLPEPVPSPDAPPDPDTPPSPDTPPGP